MAEKKAVESFFYFAEQTSPDAEDVKDWSYEIEKDKTGDLWWLNFRACLHEFGIIGRNPRQYLGDNIMGLITSSDKIQSQIKRDGWFGEQDHPWPKKDGEKLSQKRILNVFMPNRSHKIRNPKLEGNKLYGDIQTAMTDAGKSMRDEIVAGLIPCFSCRCVGGMKIIDRKPTVIAKILVCYDWVLYPGFDSAQMVSVPVAKTKAVPINESAESTMHGGFCIPFEELACDLVEQDENIAAFMESYDLDLNAVKGMTEDRSHVCLQTGNNSYICAGISEDSVKKVKDFYRSFRL